jgi:carboxypeptidase PM20D1
MHEDDDRAVERLRALVRIPTVSHRDPADVDTASFDRLLGTLEEQFPLLHQRLELARVGSHALLFRWPGARTERPVVLMAHLDVVPAGDEERWQHPPFSAHLENGEVWGRGTLDDKGCVAGICEAVERLLAEDWTPAQDVWLSFGCDEEVSGGAAEAAVAHLTGLGVRPWLVLDEGGAVAHQALPGVTKPVAVIGVTEKGTTSLELTVEGRGGHASTPARNGPTVRLARAILAVEKAPFRARTPAATIDLLERVAPHAPRALRPVLARAARLQPLVTRVLLAAGPESAAMTRTTVAVTTLEGSPALNVIASTARAGVNVRVMVGDTVSGVVEHLRKAIGDDEVRIDVVEANEPSPVSPTDDDAFALLTDTIGLVFPDAVAAPYVMMGATDSRFFTAICERVYRFAPFRMTKDQRDSVHAYDERLSVDAYLEGVQWYRRLLEGLPT